MYYRRKIILALLEAFKMSMNKTQFQKYLFLVSQKQIENNIIPNYTFIPYQYGCYSFQAVSDVELLSKNGLINSDDKISKKENESYLQQLKTDDRHIIKNVYYAHKDKTMDELIKYIYQKYPYYAMNSKIANKHLSKYELEKLSTYKNTVNNYTLCSIGYEGISIEEYINKLIKNNISIVCDVRKNAISKKYGFSKNMLKNCLNNVNIEYTHIPELGIESEKRQVLNTQSDYDKLFNNYKINNLSKKDVFINNIFNLFLDKKRLALTCFENDPKQCHRTIVLEAITKLNSWNNSKYEVKNL